MKKHKCKLCPFTAKRLADLRTHWQDDHGSEYNKVSKWLGESDDDILAVDKVAKEGMIGHDCTRA